MIDKTVGEQLNAVSERIRNDKSLERTAREQWAKACRSMPLQGTGTTASLPPLWLELKPIRAVAAQPTVNATAVIVAVGIEAESRITPTETKPNCPFPDKISIVPPTAAGIGIGVPIDLPFTELDKILEAQLAGRTFPGGRLRLGRRHRQEGHCFSGRRPVADLAVGARQGEEELVRLRRPTPPFTSGAGRCSTRRTRPCG